MNTKRKGLLGAILEVAYHCLASGPHRRDSRVQNILNIIIISQGYKRQKHSLLQISCHSVSSSCIPPSASQKTHFVNQTTNCFTYFEQNIHLCHAMNQIRSYFFPLRSVIKLVLNTDTYLKRHSIPGYKNSVISSQYTCLLSFTPVA